MLRMAEERDVPRLLEIYTPYVLHTAVTFEYDVPSLDAFAARMREIQTMYPYLAYERGGRVIGYAYAHRNMPRAAYAWCAETSVYVDADARHTGAGTALYMALIELLRAQGVRRAHAVVTMPNRDSERLHARFGFASVGVYHRAGWKLGAWHDILCLEKALREDDGAPSPLVPVSRLAPEAVSAALQLGVDQA